MTPQTLQQSIWSCAIGESPAAAGLGKQSRGEKKESWIELPVKTVLIYNKRCSSKSIAGTLLWLCPREERACKHQSFGQMAPGLLSHLHNTAAKAVLQLLEAQQVPRSETAPAPVPEGTAQLTVTPSVDGSWPTAVRGGSYFLMWNEDSVSVGCKIQMFSPLCIADVGDVFPTAHSAHPVSRAAQLCHPRDNQDKNHYLSHPSFINVYVFLRTPQQQSLLIYCAQCLNFWIKMQCKLKPKLITITRCRFHRAVIPRKEAESRWVGSPSLPGEAPQDLGTQTVTVLLFLSSVLWCQRPHTAPLTRTDDHGVIDLRPFTCMC